MRAILFLIAIRLAAQQPFLWERKQNTFHVGELQLELASASGFRVSRATGAAPRRALSEEMVEAKTTALVSGLRIETDELRIEVSSSTGLVAVYAGPLKLLAEAATGSGIQFELPVLEKFYGLGPRGDAAMDARGQILTPAAPFTISSRGYALWLDRTAVFDVGRSASNRLHIRDAREYYFAFGPSVKEIWEQRMKISGAVTAPSPSDLEVVSGDRIPKGAVPVSTGDLCRDTRALVHASLSGVLLPAFDLGKYRDLDEVAFRRAMGIGLFAPILYDSSGKSLPETFRTARKRSSHYLVVYADEARARAYPMIHPLLMQFPRDPVAGSTLNAFMLGDELLVIPFCDASRREMYLPMGTWTDWQTNKSYTGRQKVTFEDDGTGVVVLAKNGSVVPLNGAKAGDPTELHYFPKSGGEFFIYEPELPDYSQAHAGPAADIYRVQIESKVARPYEWVLHQMDRPKAIRLPDDSTPFTEVPHAGPMKHRTWRYDQQTRKLHFGIDAAAHSDIIINIEY